MRKFLTALLVLLLIPALYVSAVSYAHTDISTLPPLESGDLIFETTITNQTLATILATGSLYTHVGVVHKTPAGVSVVQASRTVVESPLPEFIEGGWGGRLTIMRYEGLTDAMRDAIVKNAETYLGRPYNYSFYMPGKEIYCSEIPYFAFTAEHIPLGTLQKISDLNVNNPAVKDLFKKRWKLHPACQKPGMDYESCWQTVMNEPIITPASVARDPHLVTLYSNYLF